MSLIAGLDVRPRELAIAWRDGHRSLFHALWLRDSCPCAACSHPGRVLESPASQLRFKLEPGDLFAVDTLRALHGRTAFAGAGRRHLQGCYADVDGLRSRLAVLRRAAAVGLPA